MTEQSGGATGCAAIASATLHDLFDAAPFGVWIAGADGVLCYMNAAGAALLDLAPGDLGSAAVLLGELCEQDGAPLSPEALPLARALRGERADNVRLQLWVGDSELYLGVSYAPTADGGAFLSAGDRTAERQLERARDDFLAAVAHDLRSPLTSIRGSAQLAMRWVKRNTSSADLLEKCLDNVDAAAGRLNRMLQTLMDSVRVERGALTPQTAPTDLAAIVNDVVAHHQLESRRHSFSVDGVEQPIVGQWDAALLERAVENLIGNAVKYSPEGGAIAVACAVEDGAARLVVRDQGVGIPAAALPHIFERFYRANRESLGEIEGNGLGLFAVRGIVTAHGGTIAARSEEGAGTEMTVLLPLAEPEEP
jgi:signal transduction histidine kinase